MDIYTVSRHMKEQLDGGKYEPHEIVVALVAMAKSGHIKKKDIKTILLDIFPRGEALKALNVASHLIDKQLIDTILKEVNE